MGEEGGEPEPKRRQVEEGNVMNMDMMVGIFAGVGNEGWNCGDEGAGGEMFSRFRVAKNLMLIGSPVTEVLKEIGLLGQSLPKEMQREIEEGASRH